jgi:hypothetical protein
LLHDNLDFLYAGPGRRDRQSAGHEGLAVNGLEVSAVNGEIRLVVAVQIELTQSDADMDGFLEDCRGHDCPVPGHFSGRSECGNFDRCNRKHSSVGARNSLTAGVG